MIKKIFLDTLGIILVICFFAVTFKTFFGINTPYLQTYTTELGQQITYYDYSAYFMQINNSFNNFGQQLQLQLPSRQWVNVGGLDWFADLANNLAVVFNWIYFPLNVILWPIRLLTWILKETLILLGFVEFTTTVNNVTYNPEWFMTTLSWLSQNLAIPYI
jgi:hypothetical protein